MSVIVIKSGFSGSPAAIKKCSGEETGYAEKDYYFSARSIKKKTIVIREQRVEGAAAVPAIFIFGDSLVDDGNNNYLNSIAKSNFFPYGIDYNRGPSGRFCNGRTFSDLLGEWLGIGAPPAYADPMTRGDRILKGVNYASASAGILDESGQHYGDRFSLSQQVVNFENTLSNLRRMMSPADLTTYLARSMTIMVFGSNDYINNYLLTTMYPTRSIFPVPRDFANHLLNRYARQIHTLYSLGLRKFFISGIGPLGCIPNQLATGQAPPGRCVDSVNQLLGTYNEGLRSLVDILNNGTHPGGIFLYGNTYGIFGDILNNPGRYGFRVVDRGCCGLGRNQGQITCVPFMMPCLDRTQYVFWDAFHPTQTANAVFAQRSFSGPPSDCYPINVQQLSLIQN